CYCGRRLTSANAAGRPTPRTPARTTYPPASALAVNVGATAMPDALVSTSALRERLEPKRPLGPCTGAEKVTTACGTGFPFASVTVTASRTGKAARVDADAAAATPALTLVGLPAPYAEHRRGRRSTATSRRGCRA